MDASASLLSLRYLVFADKDCKHLVAAFYSRGDALQYVHLYFPFGGVVVDTHKPEPNHGHQPLKIWPL